MGPLPDPGSSGSLDICESDAPVDLFGSLNGTPDTGGTWSPALASGSGIFDPAVDAPGTYTYTVAGTPPCGDASATVTVSISPVPDAGTNGSLNICENDVPVDLFDSLGGTPETGGTWSPALASGSGIFDPAVDAPGTYTYSLTGPGFCGEDFSTVEVSITNAPEVTGISVIANDVCLGEDASVILSGATQLTDGDYTLTYDLSGSNTSQNTVIINFMGGTANFTVPPSSLNNSGATSISITSLAYNVTGCNGDTTVIPSTTFNVLQDPTPQLLEDGNSFCTEDNPTIADLSNNIIGNAPVIWYDSFEDGIPYLDSDLLVGGSTYYASFETEGGCNNGIRLAVIVAINSCEELELIIPDGFSPNDDTINDTFHIRNLRELFPNFKLQIYNRYGNILYEGDINTPNWNGTSDKGMEFGSSTLPVGVYFYILELNDSTKKTIQGRVYLSR